MAISTEWQIIEFKKKKKPFSKSKAFKNIL